MQLDDCNCSNSDFHAKVFSIIQLILPHKKCTNMLFCMHSIYFDCVNINAYSVFKYFRCTGADALISMHNTMYWTIRHCSERVGILFLYA